MSPRHSSAANRCSSVKSLLRGYYSRQSTAVTVTSFIIVTNMVILMTVIIRGAWVRRPSCGG